MIKRMKWFCMDSSEQHFKEMVSHPPAYEKIYKREFIKQNREPCRLSVTCLFRSLEPSMKPEILRCGVPLLPIDSFPPLRTAGTPAALCSDVPPLPIGPSPPPRPSEGAQPPIPSAWTALVPHSDLAELYGLSLDGTLQRLLAEMSAPLPAVKHNRAAKDYSLSLRTISYTTRKGEEQI